MDMSIKKFGTEKKYTVITMNHGSYMPFGKALLEYYFGDKTAELTLEFRDGRQLAPIILHTSP